MLSASTIPVPPAMRLATFDVDINTETILADKQDLMMEPDCVMHELVTCTSQSTIILPMLNWKPCIAVTL